MNIAILAGNVGKDNPEIRVTPNGLAIATFSLATSKKVKGEKVTEWHNLKAFGKTAETAEKYVTAGMKLCVRGEIRTEKWEGNDGQKKQKTVIVVDELQMMGGGAERRTLPMDAVPPPPTKDDEFNDTIPF